MDDFAKAIHIEPKLLKAMIAIVIIAVAYEINPTVGTALGLLAILAILTQK